MQGDRTDLHGSLAVRLLEVSVVYIYRYTKLPLFKKSDFVIEEAREIANQVVILCLNRGHGRSGMMEMEL